MAIAPDIIGAQAATIAAMLGGVEVTVTYERLDEAATAVINRTNRLERIRDDMERMAQQLPGFWESDVCDITTESLTKVFEALEKIFVEFNTHSKNLQTIARQYTQAGKDSGSYVQSLSSDVII